MHPLATRLLCPNRWAAQSDAVPTWNLPALLGTVLMHRRKSGALRANERLLITDPLRPGLISGHDWPILLCRGLTRLLRSYLRIGITDPMLSRLVSTQHRLLLLHHD